MKMRVLLAAAGLVASLATAGVAATPAAAAPSDCASQYLCAYPQAYYQGGAGPVKDNNADLRQYSKFRYVQSIFNNGASCTAYLWSKPNYQGVMHTLSRGQGYPTLDNIPEYRTTGIQSNHWCTSR
ncbi:MULTISPECIES: peptidase inhibitor family I36 protein [unclassified Streptomyces]|uniref:peptidase inhibitor family I36 protein n=1 Tax=unclassified Streptomyces TaxID=2593676 RepID=UPI00378A7092